MEITRFAAGVIMIDRMVALYISRFAFAEGFKSRISLVSCVVLCCVSSFNALLVVFRSGRVARRVTHLPDNRLFLV